jgi:hypothetical protein
MAGRGSLLDGGADHHDPWMNKFGEIYDVLEPTLRSGSALALDLPVSPPRTSQAESEAVVSTDSASETYINAYIARHRVYITAEAALPSLNEAVPFAHCILRDEDGRPFNIKLSDDSYPLYRIRSQSSEPAFAQNSVEGDAIHTVEDEASADKRNEHSAVDAMRAVQRLPDATAVRQPLLFSRIVPNRRHRT